MQWCLLVWSAMWEWSYYLTFGDCFCICHEEFICWGTSLPESGPVADSGQSQHCHCSPCCLTWTIQDGGYQWSFIPLILMALLHSNKFVASFQDELLANPMSLLMLLECSHILTASFAKKWTGGHFK